MIEKKEELKQEILKYINKKRVWDGIPIKRYMPKSGDLINAGYDNPIIVMIIGESSWGLNLGKNKEDAIEVSEKFKSPILFLDYTKLSLDLYNYIVEWQYEYNGIFKSNVGRVAKEGVEDWKLSINNRKNIISRIFISTDGVGKIAFSYRDIDVMSPRSMRNRESLKFSEPTYMSSPSDWGTRFHSTGITRKRIK